MSRHDGTVRRAPRSPAPRDWTDEDLLAAMQTAVRDGRAPTRKQWDAVPAPPCSHTLIARLGDGMGWVGVWDHVGAIVAWNNTPIERDEAIGLIHDYVYEHDRLPQPPTRLGPRSLCALRLVRALGATSWSNALDIAMAGHPARARLHTHPANGARHTDAELHAALAAFLATHDGHLTSRDWDAWAARGPDRPRFAVLKRRLGYDAVTAATGITVSRQRMSRHELAARRAHARDTLREIAALLGRTPRRAELDPQRLATRPEPHVRHAATDGRWMPIDAILAAYGGTWTTALSDAGLPRLDMRDGIILALIDYRQRFGPWPSTVDVAMDRARRHPRTYPARAARYRAWGGPCDTTIKAHFGTSANAVQAAKLRRPDLCGEQDAITPAAQGAIAAPSGR